MKKIKSARRRFLDKINLRIKSIVKHTGIDIDDLLKRVDDIDHVYVTSANRINVDAADWNSDIEAVLERRFKTYSQLNANASKQVDKKLETFVGPMRPNERSIMINKEIKAKFEFDAEMEEFFGKYYEGIEDTLPYKATTTIQYQLLLQELTDLGLLWETGVGSYTDAMDTYERVKKLIDELRSMK